MSFNVQTLKSASDDLIPSFLREAQNGTTSAINHDSLMEWGLITKGARIINNDNVNNLEVKIHSKQGTSLIIPPNSELVLSEWFSAIFITPDGTTGNFQLTLEVANLNEARKIPLGRKRN